MILRKKMRPPQMDAQPPWAPSLIVKTTILLHIILLRFHLYSQNKNGGGRVEVPLWAQKWRSRYGIKSLRPFKSTSALTMRDYSKCLFLCLSNAIRQRYTAQYNKLILWKLMREKNGRPATASKNEVPLLGKKFVCVCVKLDTFQTTNFR